jgi:hypothetical protein
MIAKFAKKEGILASKWAILATKVRYLAEQAGYFGNKCEAFSAAGIIFKTSEVLGFGL